VQQRDLDAIIGAYALRPRHKVTNATLLEFGSWNLGDDSEGALIELFRVRELIAFSALSERRFFGGHFDYTNYDSYALTVQRFSPGQGNTFAFTTRRRDGGASALWGSDEFAFHMPLHVAAGQSMRLDTALLSASIQHAWSSSNILEAIKEFNSSNTDSSIVQPHVEMVMMKSAWEALLKVDQSAASFERELLAIVGDTTEPFPPGPLAERWRSSSQRSTRLLGAWAREFCKLRGKAAHGAGGTLPAIWSEENHLLFCALLFPLVFKKVLAPLSPELLRPKDTWKLAHIDKYLAFDPLSIDMIDTGGRHPWSELDSIALFSGVKW
jgi:hypothetical protein